MALPIAVLRKPAGGDELRAARWDHVEVALEIRWHDRRAPGLGEGGWTRRIRSRRRSDGGGGLARLAGRLQGLALPIPVGIGHRLQLIEQAQHPERTQISGDRGAGFAAFHIGHGEAAHAHPLRNILEPPAAPQPGGADVAAQLLQGLLQSRRGVLNDGTELG